MCLFRGKWSKWKIKEEADIIKKHRKTSEEIVVGYCILQERMCLKCGYIELSKQEIKISRG